MAEDHLLLVHLLLDMQLIDSEGIRCGRVDDVELDDSDPPRVTALLSGAGVARGRLPDPVRRWLRAFFGDPVEGVDMIRIPWGEVKGIDADVRLLKPAAELGLGRGDEIVRGVAERVPWRHKR
jgi:sporulation protein YlmC with PRC-barrel domain